MASPANSSLAENEIPILDLGPYFAGEVGALEVLGRELYRASTEVGFYFVKNHGVSQSLIDQAFAESKRFHDQSLEEKRKLKVDKNKIGYFEVESSITRHSDLAAGAKPNLYAPTVFAANWHRTIQIFWQAFLTVQSIDGLIAAGLSREPVGLFDRR